MAEKKNRVLMRINGQEYPIAGQEPKEYLIRVGTYVDERMEEIGRLNRQLSLSMVAVLTSINIADEFLKLQDAYETLEKSAPPTDEQMEQMRQELAQKIGSLQQEKEYSKSLQKRLNTAKQEQEKMRQTHEEADRKLKEQEQELEKARNVIKDLQEQLFENQMKVAEMKKSPKVAGKTPTQQ